MMIPTTTTHHGSRQMPIKMSRIAQRYSPIMVLFAFVDG